MITWNYNSIRKNNRRGRTKRKKKKDTQTKKKISKKVKLFEEKESDNYIEQAKQKTAEVLEIAPLKEIPNKSFEQN